MDTIIDMPSTGKAIAVRPDHQAPLPMTGSRAAMAIIERFLNAPDVEAARVNSALDFYERMRLIDARQAFDAAMASAKADMPVIVKDRQVSFNGTAYKHEDLAGIARVVDPVLARHGLSYRYRTSSRPGEPITVVCVITHLLGHSEETELSAGADVSGKKNAIQAIGSTVSYLQRYTLKAALGLAAAHDDDGRATDERTAEPARDMVPDQAPDYDDVRISQERIEELTGLIAETNSSMDRFLKYAKVGTLAEIRAADFSRLRAMLIAKRSQANGSR